MLNGARGRPESRLFEQSCGGARVTPLLEAPTWTLRVFDVGVPEPGLIISIEAVPAAVEVPDALRFVDEM